MKDSDSKNLLVQRTNNGPTVQIRLAGRQPSTNSCVHVNGQSSQWFDVKRGTRQGETLSPYLFIICAELLASVIRQNENMHSINILDEEILLSLFADDTTFSLDDTRESFCSCMCVLQLLASMFGVNINVDETKAVWI